MSYDNYKKGVEIAKELSRYFIKGGDVSKERIEEMEKKLNIKLSNQVYDYLHNYGYIGLIYNDKQILKYTLKNREEWKLPLKWIEIYNYYDDGAYVYLDYDNINEEGEPRVILAEYNGDGYQMLEVLGEDFGDFLLEEAKIQMSLEKECEADDFYKKGLKIIYDSLYENNVLELVLDKAENKFEAFLNYLKNKNDTFYPFVMILTENNKKVIITDDTKTRKTWSEDEIKKIIENIKMVRDKIKAVIIFNNMRIEEKNKNAIKVLMEYEGREAYETTIEINIVGKINKTIHIGDLYNKRKENKRIVCIDDFYNKQKIENFIWTK